MTGEHDIAAERLTSRTIVAEPLTPEAFAPIGEILTESGPPLDHVYGETMDVYLTGKLEADADVEYVLTRYYLREPRVLYLERHKQITQTFIPLEGHPFLLIAAPPDTPLENGIPRPEDVRAFIIPGNVGVNMHRGTWHEVPMPLVDGQMILLTSHHGVTSGWAELDEHGEISKEETDEEKRDVTERTGVVLMVEVEESS